MNNGKYYWLRLKRDFFKRHDISIIEAMPNGKDYILFYLKLLCESVDHEGNLRFSDEIPYNEQMLSTITSTNIDIVRSAIKVFTQLNMMCILDDGTYYMNEVNKMIGSSSQDEHTKESTRLRVQAYRERQKQLQLSENTDEKRYSNVTCNGEIELEKEIDIELDKEKEIKKEKKAKPPLHKFGTYGRVMLTQEQYDRLVSEFGKAYIEEMIFRLDEYVQGNNNKNKYKDFNAVLRNAIRNNWFNMNDLDYLKNKNNDNRDKHPVREEKESLEAFKKRCLSLGWEYNDKTDTFKNLYTGFEEL